MIDIQEGLTFDDVLLIPKYWGGGSRSEIDLSVSAPKGFKFQIPIISSNMKDVSETAMANAIGKLGGLTLLHRFCSIEENIKMFQDCQYKNNVGCSIGIKEEDKERARLVIEAGCRIICIDVAHGHSRGTKNMVEYIAKTYPKILLIAGNVATKDGTKFLLDAGADMIKNGIGNGSSCLTRINAAAGIPLLSSLSEGFTSFKDCNLIADGGCRTSGDVVKALCFANFIMTGNMLSGSNEAPGRVITIDGIDYKEYAGSSTHKNKNIEGVKALVPCKGPVEKVIEGILDGLRSGCSYQGVDKVADLRRDPQFIKMTNAGLIESHAHDVKIRN